MLEWIGSKMNERILKLALDAGLLNYVDNETPRHYFVHGHADLEEVEKFAELIVQECIDLISPYTIKGVEMIDVGTHLHPIYVIRENFGMEMK
jgi:hypothetical protein